MLGRSAVTALVVVLAAVRVTAQQVDVIRGQVTVAPPVTPVEGVKVRVTSSAGGVTRTAITDRNGRYSVIFDNGEGGYWVDFAKIGYAPQRREIRRIGAEAVLILDVRMASTLASATLDSVVVNGQRTTVRAVPNRNTADPDVSGNARALTSGAIPPDLAGNLAAMVDGIPGLQMIPGLGGAPDTYSALGLDGIQNSVVFDGLGSGITILPPDMIGSISISTLSYDPSVGGFAGAQVSIASQPGSNFSRRAVSHGNVLPALEWTDARAAAQAQKYTSLRLGGNAAGPLVLDRMFYNTSWNVSRRTADALTLLNTTPLGFAAAGVAADSVTRLTDILRRQDAPTLLGEIAPLQTQTAAQLQATLDWSPTTAGTGASYALSAVGNYQRSDPVGVGLLATPAHAGASAPWQGNVGARHTGYVGIGGVGVLSVSRIGAAGTRSTTTPWVILPEGIVRVRSVLTDGTSPVRSFAFGGSGVDQRNTTSTVQARNDLSWFSADNHHTLKLTTSAWRSAFTTDNAGGTLGRFVFNSLGDLETGRAAAFTRTLSHRMQSASQLGAAASLGDYWRPKPSLQVQYGVRVDGAHFATTPAFNRSVFDAFGLRNGAVPNGLSVSPRLGLQWRYGASPTVAYAQGAFRPPAAVIHAGVGVFQNVGGPQLIGSALTATGLPGSTQSIACVGDAVPAVSWNTYLFDPESIPTACADGSAGSIFSTTAPNVSLFDPRYRQPRSLRGSTDWAGPVLDNRFMFGVQTVITHALNQSGTIDVNVDTTTRFVLDLEGGRPVFADPAAIVPETGAIAPGDGRVSSAVQRVSVVRSGLELHSRLVSIGLSPITPNRRLKWTLSYSLLDGDQTFYGFTSTAGNPFDVGRGRLLQGGRHTIALSWRNFPMFEWVYVSANVRLMSGQRYTPRVAGDVNGDGVSNDRAFIDSASLASLRDPLSHARECLSRQVGRLAGFGSCASPWTSASSLQLALNPVKFHLPKRAMVSFSLQNPFALADLALHGSERIHGWGQSIAPDPTLLVVRGFDSATRQFRYDVNPRFGSTRPQQSLDRAPASLTMTMQIDVGVPRERQALILALDAARGHPAATSDDRALWRLGVGSIPDPMRMILLSSAALDLTRAQADSLATLSLWFSVFADSVWIPASRALAALPERYDRGEAYLQYVAAREKTMDRLLAIVAEAKAVLTPSQRRKLPPQIFIYLDEQVLKFLRSSSAGDIGILVR